MPSVQFGCKPWATSVSRLPSARVSPVASGLTSCFTAVASSVAQRDVCAVGASFSLGRGRTTNPTGRTYSPAGCCLSKLCSSSSLSPSSVGESLCKHSSIQVLLCQTATTAFTRARGAQRRDEGRAQMSPNQPEFFAAALGVASLFRGRPDGCERLSGTCRDLGT